MRHGKVLQRFLPGHVRSNELCTPLPFQLEPAQGLFCLWRLVPKPLDTLVRQPATCGLQAAAARVGEGAHELAPQFANGCATGEVNVAEVRGLAEVGDDFAHAGRAQRCGAEQELLHLALGHSCQDLGDVVILDRDRHEGRREAGQVRDVGRQASAARLLKPLLVLGLLEPRPGLWMPHLLCLGLGQRAEWPCVAQLAELLQLHGCDALFCHQAPVNKGLLREQLLKDLPPRLDIRAVDQVSLDLLLGGNHLAVKGPQPGQSVDRLRPVVGQLRQRVRDQHKVAQEVKVLQPLDLSNAGDPVLRDAELPQARHVLSGERRNGRDVVVPHVQHLQLPQRGNPLERR
mmetsp:Transcript_105683/g.328184  ORF Transcript_105683/g.328184 Transcript_105683/m.328184 type:complete len:345 (-) Transcript_105683:1202-2236(-)